jgi:NitT/TauT family transport system substrate-binding protein
MTILFRGAQALLLGVALVLSPLASSLARAQDNVTVGTVGSVSANLWPVFIGIHKGFFAAEKIKLDVIFVQSSANLVQQLAAGSLDITMSTGLVDPIRAIDRQAPLAIVRFEVQAPPYALLAKSNIKSLKELKGKTISLGGPKDITKIYVERMLAPHGVKPGEFDMVFAGATSARASALQAGAVDAAILLPPFNFHATAAGFNDLGLTVDYAPELPFSGTVVNRNWAAKNLALLQRILAAHKKSVEWFYDTKNREEAVKLMTTLSRIKTEDVAKSYDFLHKGNFFERTGAISRTKLNALIAALQQLGDLPASFDVERLVLSGVTQLSK